MQNERSLNKAREKITKVVIPCLSHTQSLNPACARVCVFTHVPRGLSPLGFTGQTQTNMHIHRAHGGFLISQSLSENQTLVVRCSKPPQLADCPLW